MRLSARISVATIGVLLAFVVFGELPVDSQNLQKSINSTSENRATPPATSVPEQPFQQLADYRIVAANDLGMHCGDLDQRIASILPPFNVLHAQVFRKGHKPRLIDETQVEVLYSASSNPNDPALANSGPAFVYKTNFWDINPRTGRPLAFDAFDPYYPPGVLELFPLAPDIGLPVPDLQRLYLGDGQLAADQQAMPSAASASPFVTQAYQSNVPQRFALFYRSYPFFIHFPFGYTLTRINWFSAEGIPMAPFDDRGRENPYPLMRVQAIAKEGNSLGLAPGTVLSSLDTVTPVSGEVSCGTCHLSAADGGNGLATDSKGFVIAKPSDDPQFGNVPEEVSLEYAYDLNVLRLHDVKHRTNLESETPVSCQRCHYTPALDLAHVGPQGPGANANGREQTLHQSFSRVMHTFHGELTLNGSPLFPPMPPPNGRSADVRDDILDRTCYMCHPGRVTKCYRGAMFNAGAACQDCHGDLTQVGNDFSRNVTANNPGAFVVEGDYHTNPNTPRIPWANEPGCQSCHTGDVLRNLADSPGVIRSPNGVRLLQAFRTSDANAKPIVAVNRRFAENQSGGKQVLYRLSKGHGGVFCEGCHGSTHAEWPINTPNSNDNVAATQMQGHAGTIVECQVCHGTNTFVLKDFQRNFDANRWMKGPHGMHPVNDPMWTDRHKEVFNDGGTPPGTCQACHGAQLEGSVLAQTAADRNLRCKEAPGCEDTRQGKRIQVAEGTSISCGLCHKTPKT